MQISQSQPQSLLSGVVPVVVVVVEDDIMFLAAVSKKISTSHFPMIIRRDR
jgi:hypothetical protein